MRKVANADFVKNSFATRCRLRSTFRPSRRPRPQCDRLDDRGRALQHLRPHVDDERQRRVSEPRVRRVPHGHDEQRCMGFSGQLDCSLHGPLCAGRAVRSQDYRPHLAPPSSLKGSRGLRIRASAEPRCGFTAAASLPALQPRNRGRGADSRARVDDDAAVRAGDHGIQVELRHFGQIVGKTRDP